MDNVPVIITILMGCVPLVMSACSDPSATYIDLSNKGITIVDETLFRNCNLAATSIDLSGNKITKIDANAFASYDSNTGKYIPSFYQLKTLLLNDNEITEINNLTFQNTNRLTTLSLSNNKITVLESGVFDHLSDYLEKLNISNNEIKIIGLSVFTKFFRNLRIVDLAYNHLESMEAWPYIPPNIVAFNLSNNRINKFTNHLNWTYDLQEPYHAYVDLKNNSFTIWNDEWFRQYQKPGGDFVGDFVTYRMDLTRNPWVCDCQMHYMASKIQDSFYKYAESELLYVDCENPPELRRQRIIEIDLNKFICNVTVDCPSGCQCLNLSESRILQVDCKNGNLTRLPDNLPSIPARTIDLDVSNNTIRLINPRPYIDKISSLSVQNNKLVYIDQETVKNMTQCQTFNISNNQLQFLPNSIQNFRKPQISIYNNPFTCDCNMTWMAGWLDLDTAESRDKSVECRRENGDVHKIIEVTESLLDCNYSTEIGLAVGFGILLIIVVIGIVWAKRCPYETKVLLFKFFRIHPSDKYKVDEDGTEKEYDIYTSFDDTNVHIRQWVLKKFKKKLEIKEEAPKYRIFIPIIHLLPGQEKGDSIIRAMEKSKRVVIILSDKYDQNEWSVFECQQAEMLNPNEGRIIFIKYHPEADEMVLKEPWKSRVKDRKVLAIGEKSSEHRWFWDKLRYELPVK